MTEEAVGIHDHPTRRLGRRKPSNKPALRAAEFLVGTGVTHDASADYFSLVSDWGLYNNDLVGICGPTSVANSRKLTTRYATNQEESPSQQDTDDLYRASGNPGYTGNPNNPGEDNGVDMQTMCEQLVKVGIGGVKALGFAKVDVSDLSQLDAAIDTFGFLLLGVDLQVAQQSQTDNKLWDYLRSSDWGGHAILCGKYREVSGTGSRRAVVTWAEVVDMTDAFERHQLEEAWAVIWPEHLLHPNFRAGFDINAFAKAYTDITGKAFPATIPPAPAPTPAPSPAPGPFPAPTPAPTPDPAAPDATVVALADALKRFDGHSACPHYLRVAAQAWLEANNL